MKLLILYYSGTGNTRFACDVARLALERAGHEVEMVTYAKSDSLNIASFDAYCFAAPVYEWAPAVNVERFVRGMRRLDGKCAFILTSSAGAKGQATNLFAQMLADKGIKVLGDHNLICPDSWGGSRRWSYKLDAESPTPESVRELLDFVGRITDAIGAFLEGKAVAAPEYRVRPTGLYIASRLSRLAPSARVKMGRKRVDTELCNQCGVCEKNCPSGAIRLAPEPVFDKECIACWRCINTCPKDCITTAIDSGHHYKGVAREKELLEGAGLLRGDVPRE